MIWICHAVNHVDNAPAAPAIMRRFNPLALARGKEQVAVKREGKWQMQELLSKKSPAALENSDKWTNREVHMHAFRPVYPQPNYPPPFGRLT